MSRSNKTTLARLAHKELRRIEGRTSAAKPGVDVIPLSEGDKINRIFLAVQQTGDRRGDHRHMIAHAKVLARRAERKRLNKISF